MNDAELTPYANQLCLREGQGLTTAAERLRTSLQHFIRTIEASPVEDDEMTAIEALHADILKQAVRLSTLLDKAQHLEAATDTSDRRQYNVGAIWEQDLQQLEMVTPRHDRAWRSPGVISPEQQEYFERLGDLRLLRDRFDEIQEEYAEEQGVREHRLDQEDILSDTDSEFHARFYQDLKKLGKEFELLSREVEQMKQACEWKGLVTDPDIYARQDEDESDDIEPPGGDGPADQQHITNGKFNDNHSDNVATVSAESKTSIEAWLKKCHLEPDSVFSDQGFAPSESESSVGVPLDQAGQTSDPDG